MLVVIEVVVVAAYTAETAGPPFWHHTLCV
jgi:hypothetical protein